MRGKFIAIEGGEGAGKSSVIHDLAARIKARGHDVLVTREPGGTPGAEAIRRILVTSTENCNYDPMVNAMLFAAARRDHVEKAIRPRLEAGNWVITDRFFLSTLAYQGGGEGVDRQFLIRMQEETTGGLWPDLTIVMDIDPRIGLERSRRRLADQGSNEGRFEDFDLDFHDRLRTEMLRYDLSPKIVIDASDPQPVVLQTAVEKTEAFLNSVASDLKK